MDMLYQKSGNEPAYEKVPTVPGRFFLWSTTRESNPYNQLGKLVFYH